MSPRPVLALLAALFHLPHKDFRLMWSPPRHLKPRLSQRACWPCLAQGPVVHCLYWVLLRPRECCPIALCPAPHQASIAASFLGLSCCYRWRGGPVPVPPKYSGQPQDPGLSGGRPRRACCSLCTSIPDKQGTGAVPAILACLSRPETYDLGSSAPGPPLRYYCCSVEEREVVC